MFGTVRDSFEKTMTQNFKTLALAIAKSAPAEKEAVEEWLSGLDTTYRGYAFFYMLGLPWDEGYHEVGGNAELFDYWKSREETQDLVDALDSVSYLESYILKDRPKIDGVSRSVILAPVPNEEGDGAAGFVIIGIDSSKTTSFTSLINALMVIAFSLFALGFVVASFSRDPITGYAILVLFAIVLTFVAYPLFEAVRLTFVKNGAFTFEIGRASCWERV